MNPPGTEYWRAEARFDWSAYVDEHGAIDPIGTPGAEHERLLMCPDCQKLKLAVNVKRRKWRCFVCAVGGTDAASLIVKVEGVWWQTAIARVLTGAQMAIGPIDKIKETAVLVNDDVRAPTWVPAPIAWPPGCELIAMGQSELCQRGRAYCESRGIPAYVIAEAHLAACDRGKYQGRLIFPVFDSTGRLIFFQARAMWAPRPNERHIKILSPSRTEATAGPADCLLGLEYLVSRAIKRALVVEGPVDYAHAWPDAVATFGKRISTRQMELLVRAGVHELDLCYDHDAIADMVKVAPILASLFRLRIVRLPEGKDPGELTKAQIEQYRAEAMEWGVGERLMRL